MLERLKMFTAVIEHGSLNKAAKALNISQPALSRKIASLEAELNIQLFERRGKKLLLTPIGEAAYDYANEFMQLERRFLQSLAAYKPETKVMLTVGASLTTLQSTLPDLISLLTTPKLQLEISAVTGKTHEIVRLVQEDHADLGLVASDVQHPDIACIPLFNDHLVLVLPNNHPLAHGKAAAMEGSKTLEALKPEASKKVASIEDLQGLPMVLFAKGTWYRVLMDELFNRYGLLPEIRMEIDSFEAILRLVHTCNMATLLPASYLRRSVLEDNELTALEIAELKLVKRTTSLIYSKNKVFSPDILALIEQAIHYLQATRQDVLA